MKKTWTTLALIALALGGISAGVALTANGDVTCNSQTASTPSHVIGVDGAPVSTIPGNSAVATACATESDQTVTVTATTTAPPPPPPPGSSANLWVDPSGSSTCTRSATLLSYANAAGHVCPTPAVADTKAIGADLVLVRAGSYGDARFSTTHASDVTISADQGATVSFDADFQPGASHLVVKNIGNDVFWIGGCTSNLSIVGGDVGPSYTPGGTYSPATDSYCNGATPADPKNVLIDGVRFHDVRYGYVGDHVQCFYVNGANGLTVRNSRFDHCDGYDMILTKSGTSNPATNVTLENNFFGPPTDTTGGIPHSCVAFFQYPAGWSNILIRNNTCAAWFEFDPGPTMTNVRMVGNLSPLGGSCRSGVIYSHNVWYGSGASPCGLSDQAYPSVADPGYANRSAGDLHIPASSVAVDRADPMSFPATDIDGQARFCGSAPDAGADEVC